MMGNARRSSRSPRGGAPGHQRDTLGTLRAGLDLDLSPVPRLRDSAEALEHARKAVGSRGTTSLLPDDAGPGRVPLGPLRGGAAALDKAKAVGGKDGATDLFLLAMIHWQKGEKEQARPWFDKAVAWMKAQSNQGMYHRLLWTEAAALLGQPGPTAAER